MPRHPAVQFYRSMRDARRHQRLVSAPNPQPLDACVIDATSNEGQRLLTEAEHVNHHLIDCVAPQEHPAFCGLATCCVVMRGLGITVSQADIFNAFDAPGAFPAPWFEYFGFPFVDAAPAAVKRVLNHHLKYDGLPLTAAVTLLRHYGLDVVNTQHGITEATLRDVLVPTLVAASPRVLVANYNRGTLKQRGTGHFAPVGAYHAGRDMCLVLEVNTYRYPSVWVPTPLLVDAMNTISPGGSKRGHMLVAAPSAAARA